MSRIEREDEALAAEFASATDQRRAEVATHAVRAAFTKAGITEPFVRVLASDPLMLEPSDRGELERRQAELDEKYLQLHEKFETDEGLNDRERDAHDRLFHQARALQALLFLADGEHGDAVYEALHAGTDDDLPTELRHLLTE
jgi:hypothetical protein